MVPQKTLIAASENILLFVHKSLNIAFLGLKSPSLKISILLTLKRVEYRLMFLDFIFFKFILSKGKIGGLNHFSHQLGSGQHCKEGCQQETLTESMLRASFVLY